MPVTGFKKILLTTVASVAAPTTIFTPAAALNADEGGFAGSSIRNILTITGGSAGRVRVTFRAGASAGLVVANAAIGVFSADQSITTATPIELLFSGVSGFNIGTGTTIVSDYVTLAFTSSDKLVAIIDETSGNIRVNQGTATNSKIEYATSPKATYNVTTPSGMGGNIPSYCYGVELVETSA